MRVAVGVFALMTMFSVAASADIEWLPAGTEIGWYAQCNLSEPACASASSIDSYETQLVITAPPHNEFPAVVIPAGSYKKGDMSPAVIEVVGQAARCLIWYQDRCFIKGSYIEIR